MARVRIEEKCNLKNWNDVNLCLAEIGEKQREIEKVEADMQKDIDAAKLTAEVTAAPHIKRIADLEAQIKLFTDGHADDMDGKKTKTLTFGQLGYRKSTKISLPQTAKKIAEIISNLKSRGMGDCVVTPPEKIDKEILKKYSAADITAAGAGLKIKDVFWYEVDRKRLAEGENK